MTAGGMTHARRGKGRASGPTRRSLAQPGIRRLARGLAPSRPDMGSPAPAGDGVAAALLRAGA